MRFLLHHSAGIAVCHGLLELICRVAEYPAATLAVIALNLVTIYATRPRPQPKGSKT